MKLKNIRLNNSESVGTVISRIDVMAALDAVIEHIGIAVCVEPLTATTGEQEISVQCSMCAGSELSLNQKCLK